MRVTIKSLKHIPSLSEETLCFTCAVYIDGKRVGEASDRGHGGGTDIYPHEVARRIDEYAKTLPDVVTDMPDPKDPTKPFSYPMSASALIDQLVDAELRAKEEARIEKKFLKDYAERAITQDKDGAVYVTKILGTVELQRYLTSETYLSKQKAAGRVILNLLPVAEARAIWMKACVR